MLLVGDIPAELALESGFIPLKREARPINPDLFREALDGDAVAFLPLLLDLPVQILFRLLDSQLSENLGEFRVLREFREACRILRGEFLELLDEALRLAVSAVQLVMSRLRRFLIGVGPSTELEALLSFSRALLAARSSAACAGRIRFL